MFQIEHTRGLHSLECHENGLWVFILLMFWSKTLVALWWLIEHCYKLEEVSHICLLA